MSTLCTTSYIPYEENVELRGIHSSFDQKVQLFKGEHQKILRKKVLNEKIGLDANREFLHPLLCSW